MSRFRELLLSLAGLGLLCLLQGQTHARPAFHYAAAHEKISLRATVMPASVGQAPHLAPILVVAAETGGVPFLRASGFTRLPLTGTAIRTSRFRVFRTGLSPPRVIAAFA